MLTILPPARQLRPGPIAPDPQGFVKSGRGTGRLVKGGIGNEIVDFGEEIGTYRDEFGVSLPTTNGQIIPLRTGAHLVPSRPNP
ncbi:hypothetical protein EON82_23435 [bacterium]|nr:MAG: hypothetical protein EON82_23435 [bacterium]